MKGIQRIISGLLSLCMVITMLPVSAFAEELADAETAILEETASIEEVVETAETVTEVTEETSALTEMGMESAEETNHTGETEIHNSKEATEFEDGYTGDTHCISSGELLEQGKGISDTHEHNYEKTIMAPTCEEKGYTVYTCKCGDRYVSDEVDALGHDYQYGYCDRCEEKDPAPATEGTCGNDARWFLDEVSGTLTISGTGKMWDYDALFEGPTKPVFCPWFGFRRAIRKVVISEGITHIGNHAFYEISQVYEVDLPQSGLVSVGEGAFRNSRLNQINLPDSVTSIGARAFSGTTLTDIVIPSGVTVIEDSLFASAGNLADVTLPDGIQEIKYGAFWGTDLSEIAIPDSVTSIGASAFCNCDSLSEIEIPRYVASLGNGAFRGCDNLETIIFKGDAPVFEATDEEGFGNYDQFEGVTASAYYPVNNSTWTEEVMQQYGGNITWVAYSFSASGTLSDNGTWTLSDDGVLTISGSGEIGIFTREDAAEIRNKIRKIVITEGVTVISEFFFAPFTAFTDLIEEYEFCTVSEIEIPASVTMADEAFYFTDNLTSISVNEDNNNYASLDGVLYNKDLTELVWYPANKQECRFVIPETVISGGVASDHITEVVIPAGFTGNIEHSQCPNLTTITVHEDNEMYVSVEGVLYSKDLSKLIAYPRNKEDTVFEIPATVRSIYASAVSNCNNLIVVKLPEGLTEIGEYAFSECTNLVEINIPDTVIILGNSAFSYCSSLRSVEIPASIQKLDDSGFYNCTALEKVILHEGLKVIGFSLFENCESLTSITIPASVNEIVQDAFAYTGLEEIVFCGDAPYFNHCAPVHRFGIFGNIEATAYYPADNDTWTEDVMQDYGGDITWIPYDGFIPAGIIEDTGRTLSLDGMIYINQYVKPEGFEGVDIEQSGGLLIWNAPISEEDAVFGTEDTHVAGLMDAGKGEYAQQGPGIVAKSYADDIYLRVYIRDNAGNYVYSPLTSYSVRDYCESRLEKSSNMKLKNTCAGLLHFGSAAQTYFNYNVDDPANKNIVDTWPQPEWDAGLIDALAEPVTNIAGTGTVTDNGKTLSLTGALFVNFYFGLDASVGTPTTAELLFWDEVDGELTLDNVSYKRDLIATGKEYAAQSDMFAAREFGKTLFVCAHFVDEDGNDHYSDVTAYSPEEYAAGRLQKSSNANLKALVKAMVTYGEYARIYFS